MIGTYSFLRARCHQKTTSAREGEREDMNAKGQLTAVQ